MCTELYEDWKKKCMSVLNSTTNTCSSECKNATYGLVKDPRGQNFMGCDCGLNDTFDGPKTPKEMAEIGQCYAHQSRMREICKFDDGGECQKCAAKKSMELYRHIVYCLTYYYSYFSLPTIL